MRQYSSLLNAQGECTKAEHEQIIFFLLFVSATMAVFFIIASCVIQILQAKIIASVISLPNTAPAPAITTKKKKIFPGEKLSYKN